MTDTGLISTPAPREIREIVFGQTMQQAIASDLPYMTEIDRAHLIMLERQTLIDRSVAVKLLECIDELRAVKFKPLRRVEPIRGTYLAYEEFLIKRLGVSVAGQLHTGRSRNDLNATLQRLQLRLPLSRLLSNILRLLSEIVARAKIESGTVMPIYTHWRQAAPATFGFYLAGVALGIVRDIEGILSAMTDLERCPLGAAAVTGSQLAIDPKLTCELLGFSAPSANSLDAVGARDFVPRLAAASGIAATTLSRIASDFLLWSSDEFGFIQLPDSLVGSSSHLPQKRNPFLLEHVQARASSAIGAYSSACFAMASKPYTNSVAVGTEAVRQIWQPITDLSETVVLLRHIIAGLTVDRRRMRHVVESGYASATAVSEILISDGMPFRTAHRRVGEYVRCAQESGKSLMQVVQAELGDHPGLTTISPQDIAASMESGGGPGINSLAGQIESLENLLGDLSERKSVLNAHHRQAQEKLDTAVTNLCRRNPLPLWMPF